MFFLMAMALYPEALKKAQEEIDTLLGPDSSTPPTFEHIDNLPYVVALCKEVFRFVPALSPVDRQRIVDESKLLV